MSVIIPIRTVADIRAAKAKAAAAEPEAKPAAESMEERRQRKIGEIGAGFGMSPEEARAAYDAAGPGQAKPEAKSKASTIIQPRPLELICPTSLEGLPVPKRQWIVPGWIPVGATTLNYADGGVGKTLLAQLLMTACATGIPWCGLEVKRCRTFGLFCEDDADEMHERQEAINSYFGLSWADLGDMMWTCPVGQDNTLATYSHGEPKLTPRLEEVRSAALDFGAGLVVLDTAGTTFGGNEIEKRQTTHFIGIVTTGLAIEIGGAVLINAHPSVAGMNSGSMTSGNVGWNNSSRSRLAMHEPQAEEGEPDQDNIRVLTCRKANYGKKGAQIRLRYHNGVLILPGSSHDISEAANAGDKMRVAEEAFLTLLDRCTKQGQRLSDSRNAANYAPKVFARRPDKAHTVREFEQAMHRLFAAEQIRMQSYGRASDTTQQIVREKGRDGLS